MSDTEKTLYTDYTKNVECLREMLRAESSFDILERHLAVCSRDMCFFFIDGFIKDAEMQRMMQTLLGLKEPASSRSIELRLPYVEIEREANLDRLVLAVLSGQTVILAESFGAEAIVADLRTYPARDTAEPEGDRVMQGARDGFVETLIMNTALIRRRIRDPRLTMEHFNMGGASSTDVVVCYVKGIADEESLGDIREKLTAAKPKSLTLGYQSLAESLIRKGWLNPFPKIRTTERPDTAAAQLMEGSIIVLCDTSPLAMILPTSIFDYLEETGDFYAPPLTGSYLRLVRAFILLLSVVITPLWYLALEYQSILPQELLFLVPDDPGALPIILQLLLAEVAIDGLKIASMNTPDILSNSLSVVGALILGDFAVEVGWLCGDVILYMAFVAIANFAQQNYELGYAFKFMRVIILALTAILGIWGFGIGIAVFILAVATNNTVLGKGYLYPLIPLNLRDLGRLVIRQRKTDFEK